MRSRSTRSRPRHVQAQALPDLAALFVPVDRALPEVAPGQGQAGLALAQRRRIDARLHRDAAEEAGRRRRRAQTARKRLVPRARGPGSGSSRGPARPRCGRAAARGPPRAAGAAAAGRVEASRISIRSGSSGPWYTVTRSSGKLFSGRAPSRSARRGRSGHREDVGGVGQGRPRADPAARGPPPSRAGGSCRRRGARSSCDFKAGAPKSSVACASCPRTNAAVRGSAGAAPAAATSSSTRSRRYGTSAAGVVQDPQVAEVRAGRFVDGAVEGHDHAARARGADRALDRRRRRRPRRRRAARPAQRTTAQRLMARFARRQPLAEAQVQVRARHAAAAPRARNDEHAVRSREASARSQNTTLPAVSANSA